MSAKPLADTGREAHPRSAALRRKALLIVNPNSRRGGEADLRAVIHMLESSGFQVIPQESKSAQQCVRELDEQCDDVDLVIVAGGDGTISSLAEALYHHRKPLAILPLGTANDLARSLAVPEDLLAAGELVVNNEQREIDLGVVNGHYFFNAVNIGLGTEITHQLTPELKKTWGSLSYLKALWGLLSRKDSFRVRIIVDGRTFEHRSIHLTIGNGRFYGGGNVVDPEAEIDNGILCLYSIRPQPVWKLLVLAPLLRLGRQRLAKQTFSVTGRRIEVHTTRPLEVHADGERVTYTPATLKVRPHALTVFAPIKRNSLMDALTETVSS